MRVPRLPEPRSVLLPRCRLLPGDREVAHFDHSRRNPSDHCELRNIPNDHGIGANDHVIADADAPEHLGTGAKLDTVPDRRGSQGVVGARVANCDAVTDQAVIAHHGIAMDDNASMVLDAQAPANARRRADDDAAGHLGKLVEDYVGDSPGRPHDLVANDKPRMPEAVHQQCPEADAQQALALRPQVLENVHRRFRYKVGPTAYAKGDGRSATESYAI